MIYRYLVSNFNSYLLAKVNKGCRSRGIELLGDVQAGEALKVAQSLCRADSVGGADTEAGISEEAARELVEQLLQIDGRDGRSPRGVTARVCSKSVQARLHTTVFILAFVAERGQSVSVHIVSLVGALADATSGALQVHACDALGSNKGKESSKQEQHHYLEQIIMRQYIETNAIDKSRKTWRFLNS